MILLPIFMLYSAGYTLLREKDWSDKQLTQSEKIFVSQIRSEIDGLCSVSPDADCKIGFEPLIMEAVNGRRISAEVMGRTSAADAVAGTCYSVTPIIEQLRCFSDIRRLNYEQAMSRAGLKRFGVSRKGYRSIRFGMSLRDVEFILGEGEEQAYSGGYGHSAAIYKWQRGGAAIVISFQDRLVSGRSQLGL